MEARQGVRKKLKKALSSTYLSIEEVINIQWIRRCEKKKLRKISSGASLCFSAENCSKFQHFEQMSYAERTSVTESGQDYLQLAGRYFAAIEPAQVQTTWALAPATPVNVMVLPEMAVSPWAVAVTTPLVESAPCA
jgi:hypothetical protein